MVFSGKYSRSPIASTNLVLKYTVFVNNLYVLCLTVAVSYFCFLLWLLTLNLCILCCCCCCCYCFLFSS
uniref:Uncharacterized protein n=1 Tax=Strigops habroptila TaxID=2489341 RepID=A0A672TMN8_STRHB